MIGNVAIRTGVIKPYFAPEHPKAYRQNEYFKAPSLAELSVEAKEFVPSSRFTLNIQAEEFTPMSEPKNLNISAPSDKDYLLKIKEFEPLHSEPENPVVDNKISTMPIEGALEENKSSEVSGEVCISENPHVEEKCVEGSEVKEKYRYGFEEIMSAFDEFVKNETFGEINKQLSDFSHRQVAVNRIKGRGNPQKRQKAKKEFLRYEEFKPIENDYWRRAKTAEEEKIHQQALATTLKLTTSVDDREKTKRKIKITLNKLSPSNIEKLQPELLSLGKESREALYYLVETLFDKSWAEVKYTPMYAHLCKYLKQEFEGYLFDGESPSKKKSNWFRYILLNCVQTAFDNAPTVPPNSHEPEIHLHLAKKKTHGNIRFIGELLKVKIVTAKIIQGIVEVLINLEHKSEAHEIDEDKLEIACVLISTAGHVFEKKNLKNETNKIFDYLNEILQNNASISSKLKFAIMV